KRAGCRPAGPHYTDSRLPAVLAGPIAPLLARHAAVTANARVTASHLARGGEMHHLLFYYLTPDYLDRRPEFRGAHLELAKAAVERGERVLGGALTGPAGMAVLLFHGSPPAADELIAASVPYVRNGLVERWEVRNWTTVVGAGAAHPV